MNNLIKKAPSILTVIASIGVVGTAVLASKATPKAIEDINAMKNERDESEIKPLDYVKAAWKNYIFAALAGFGTISCIIISNHINQKSQKAVAASYMAICKMYDSYKQRTIEKHGLEDHQDTMCDIIEKSDEYLHWCEDLVSYSHTDFGVDEDEHLFYEPNGNRYFCSTIGKVIQAEYHLNRKYSIEGAVSLNDFYEILGIDDAVDGNDRGWSNEDPVLYWIDFNNYTAKIDDLECMVIEPSYSPKFWERYFKREKNSL